jgi:hypothetical protein
MVGFYRILSFFARPNCPKPGGDSSGPGMMMQVEFQRIQENAHPDEPKGNQAVDGERFPVNKHTEHKGNGRGQILENTDGGQFKAFGSCREPQQG